MDKTPSKLDYQSVPVKPSMPAQPSIEDAQKSIILDPAYYRRILEQQIQQGIAGGMEIGGAGKFKQIWRRILFVIGLLVVAVLFSILFYYFTHNLRIALIIVTAMLVYMVISAWLAEGHIDNNRRT